MKKTYLFLISLFFVLNIFAQAIGRPLRIACVGNSITYGSGIQNREKNSYPAQLQAYLGDDYLVANFGCSGATANSKGDRPYILTTQHKESIDFLPDIVLIKLGTNDSKPQNWRYKDNLKRDYQALIDEYKQLSSHPRIILLTPVRCYLNPEANIKANIIAGEIREMVEQLAWENKLEIINLYNLFDQEWQQQLFPDRLHPSGIGAGVMAKKIGSYLTREPEKQGHDITTQLDEDITGTFNFHGHQGFAFNNGEDKCLIVKPHSEAKGRPWIIRARFWGHEPQTDIALLEQGFHVVYCDVTDLYGSPRAVERWNRLYKRMRKCGFNHKVVLEGMSRGGLIVYNWAAKNPGKVACIYADAPVMDFKSWPLGKEGTETDKRQLLEAYGFRNIDEAMKWKQNPLDHARKLAKAGIPILHVVGDDDQVVPVKENTEVFEKRMKLLEAPITVIHKPRVGHHPHSLSNPAPIVRFILKATGNDAPFYDNVPAEK